MEALKVSVKEVIKTKSGNIFNIGEVVKCTPTNNFVLIENEDKKCRIPYTKASKYLTIFKKEPSLKTLEKHSLSGITTTPIGNKVEMDGYDMYGFPSWFIINGLI